MFDSPTSGGDLGRFPSLGDAKGARSGSPAGLMWRCTATVIDIAIAVAMILVPLVALDRILAAAGVPDGEAGPIWRTTAAIWVLALFLLYSPLTVSRWGATLGKRVIRLEVVRFRDGERLGYGAAIIRHFTNLVLTLVGVSRVANVSVINLSPDRRGMHDRAAGSAVIHRR